MPCACDQAARTAATARGSGRGESGNCARRQTVANAARSLATAERSAKLMRQRFDAGTATMIDVLDAERQRTSAQQTLSQSTAAMTADYVAIQKALGLGWAAP